ncbi:hypothetical protein YC2023_000480 [Brassica napus]
MSVLIEKEKSVSRNVVRGTSQKRRKEIGRRRGEKRKRENMIGTRSSSSDKSYLHTLRRVR